MKSQGRENREERFKSGLFIYLFIFEIVATVEYNRTLSFSSFNREFENIRDASTTRHVFGIETEHSQWTNFDSGTSYCTAKLRIWRPFCRNIGREVSSLT